MYAIYKLFEEQDRYGPLHDISPFPTLIQLIDFLGGIQHCVTVAGKWIFERNIYFCFLSHMTIWTTIAIVMMKQNELMVTE